MRGEREGGGRKGLRKVETDVSPLIQHTPLSPLVVAFLSKQWHVGLFFSPPPFPWLPCTHVLQNINSLTFVREGETAEVGMWRWWWTFALCKVIRRCRVQADRHNTPHTRKLRRALFAVMCTEQSYMRGHKQHTHYVVSLPSLSLSFFFFSFRYQRLQSTPMVSRNISCRFWQM